MPTEQALERVEQHMVHHLLVSRSPLAEVLALGVALDPKEFQPQTTMSTPDMLKAKDL